MIRPLQVLAPLPLAAALLFTAGAAVAQSFAGSVLRDAGTAAETVLSSQGPQAAAADWILTARGGGTAYDGSISGGLLVTQVQAASDGSQGHAFTSRLTFTQTVTNPFASAQAVGFDFVIPATRLRIDAQRGEYRSYVLDGGARFSGRIDWGTESVWSVDYGIGAQADAPAGRLVTTESPSSRSVAAADFQWSTHNTLALADAPVGDFDPLTGEWRTTGSERVVEGAFELASGLYGKRLSLGVLGAGETRTLSYTLEASAWYADRTSEPSGHGGAGWASAGGSDPFGIQFEPTTAISFSSPVPEPGALLLMAAGLAALAGVRRRQSPR